MVSPFARLLFHQASPNVNRLTLSVGNGSVATGTGRATARASMQGSGGQALYSSPNQPFEDVLLRQRTLGQDIIPSPREPKRTESLYTPQKPTPAGANASAAAGNRSGKLKVSYREIPIFAIVVELVLSAVRVICGC